MIPEPWLKDVGNAIVEDYVKDEDEQDGKLTFYS